MTKVQTLIVGGGPSGLALAYGLQGDTLILEKESAVGGLCRSIYHDGGVFDIGGHSFHTPHPEVFNLVNELLEGGLYRQERDARIYTNETLIPYPFQKSFDQIPDPKVVEECRKGLLKASKNGITPSNFEEFIVGKFGDGIARHFMIPYNRKIWARDIRNISCEWTSERVAAPKGVEEKFDNSNGKRMPLQSDTWVAYPKKGGYQEIYDAFVPHLPGLELEKSLVHIDPKEKVATTSDGERYHWDVLVSTIPLPILTQIVEGTPENVMEAAERLDYLSLRVELLLAGRKLETPIQRIYVADPEFPAHKIALNHNSSDSLREVQRHAIMSEVSVSPEKQVDVDQIAPKTIELLSELDVITSKEDIVWQGHVDVEYGYPVYTHKRPELVDTIKDWMAQHDIYTLGRFGDWEYINSDKCIMKGLTLAKDLKETVLSKSRVF